MSELHFQASPHVQHMRVHADLYTATVASFLAELPLQGAPRMPDLKAGFCGCCLCMHPSAWLPVIVTISHGP